MDKFIIETHKYPTITNRFILKVSPDYWDRESDTNKIHSFSWEYAHCETGPAYISSNIFNNVERIRSKHWLINGLRHREDGPAIICYNASGGVVLEAYYISNKHIGTNLNLYTKESIMNYSILK